MNDDLHLKRENMTPAQRRLVEDDIQVYTPEQAEKLLQENRERKARLKRESTDKSAKAAGNGDKPKSETGG